MKKLLGKILMMVAVATIIGHNTLPHHHHMGMQYLIHQDVDHVHQSPDHGYHEHDENSDADHNIFSFAQLDDCFLPSQFSKVSIELPVLFLVTPVIRFQLNQLAESSKIHFAYYKEYPPPIDHSSHLFSRPPPTC